jgi:hypothetical protein
LAVGRARPKSGGNPRTFERETQILALILKVGLDLPEISRRSGIPLETVRYLYKEHIIKRRLRVKRELEHQKLGLEHIQFTVTADPDLEPLLYNQALGSSVWEEVYAHTVYKAIPDNLFFLDHLAPPSLHPKLRDFYSELEDLRAVEVHQVYDCTRLTHPRAWVEDYNWELPGWDFDWSASSLTQPKSAENPPASEPVRFDKTDLLLVMKFQADYDHTIASVAANIGVDRSSASWHFRKHVEARGLFGEYIIDWLGTTRDTKTGYAPKQHQSFAAILFTGKDLSSEEMMIVRAHLHSIPYLWSEKVGDSDYTANLLIPLHSLMEAFRSFSKILKPLEGKARVFTIDQSGSASFTIHPELYDEESRRWIYKGDLVLEGIRAALKGGAPGGSRKERKKRAREA